MWHIRAALIAGGGVFALLVPGVHADSLQLKNGNMVQGKYLGGTERAVQFEVNGKVRLYDIEGILSISFAAASADGGVPSNNVNPKPGDNAASNSETKEDGVLRTARSNQAPHRGVAAALVTSENKRSSGHRVELPGRLPIRSSRPSCAVVAANSKVKARVAPVSTRALRPQRERFPVLTD
jgi:hypothetical protein